MLLGKLEGNNPAGSVKDRPALSMIARAEMRGDIRPGDTLNVHVNIVEGNRSRVQVFKGFVLGRQGSGVRETFTVRKISYGEGVERVFPIYSPNVDSIKVVRRGAVRRAKLYYLRDRRGKSARIAERAGGPKAAATEE